MTSMTSAIPARSSEEKTPWLERPVFASIPAITWEKVLIAVIMLLAVFSRFYILGNRVMSHDEVNHVVPSYDLFQGRGYRHDPVTHGPFQFHIIALMFFMFGDSDFTARIPAALFSIATVFFAWWGYRKYLGKTGSLLAAFMLLISPYALFYGRYTRNEAFIGFSMVVMIYGFLRYLETGKNRYLTVVTLAVVFHFITKETSFIYMAQALIFLAGLFIYRISRREWVIPTYKRTFLTGLLVGVVLLGMAVVSMALSHPATAAAVTPTTAATAGTAASGATHQANPLTLIFGGLAIVDLLVALYFMIAGFSARALREERSFDIIILLVTFILPQLAPLPVALAGWDPLDYTNTGVIHTAIFLVPLTLLAVALGLWWKPRVWLKNWVLFFAIFVTFYTTFFSNGAGFLTGLVGALGYWISQQTVNRGSQPWYFYALIQIPVYEFLPAIGTLAAFVLALRHPQLTGFHDQPDVIEAVSTDETAPVVVEADPETLPTPEEPEAEVAGDLEPSRNWIPMVWFFIYWSASSLAAFSVAGEKMPWLTYHITLGLILAAAWAFGYLIDTTPWKRLIKNRMLPVVLLLVVFVSSLAVTIGSLLGTSLPFQGHELAQLQNTASFLVALITTLASGAGLYTLTREWTGFEVGRASGMVMLVILAILTARAAIRASYINYDNAFEYLVYAHSAAAPKEVLNEVEEISRHTVGGKDIAVAYGGDALYPYWWYFRDFPNKRWYGDTLTRDLRNNPIIIVDDKSFDKIQPIVGDAYVYYETMRLWWPNQDYFGLDWNKVSYALSNPAIRAGIWQIWFNRDYTQYAAATNNADMTLTTWQPNNRMRVYIRKDIVAEMWKYGVAPTTTAVQADPYEKGTIDLSADQVFGSQGAGTGQYDAPRGVAVASDGSLYVADSRNNRIQHVGVDGKLIQTWGAFADVSKGAAAAPGGTFNEPWGVAVGPDGSVYVTDTWNNRIQKFTADGKFVKMWGVSGQAETPDAFWGPRGVAVNAAGDVFVTDTGNKRVVVFDGDGNFITQFGTVGAENGQFDEPVGLAVSADGSVFVADTWNQRVQVFTPDATGKTYAYSKQWDISGWYGQSLDNKPFLAVDGQGNVFVTDPEGYRILEFKSDGTFERAWGDNGVGPNNFGLAAAVAADASGNVWVTDAGNMRIMHFTLPK